MKNTFYQDFELKYPEIGIALEDFHYKSKAKIFIPVLLPEMSSTSATKGTRRSKAASNIVNSNGKRGIGSCTITNYVELTVPSYIASGLTDKDGIIKKGTKFILVFVGGEINNPKIIGVD